VFSRSENRENHTKTAFRAHGRKLDHRWLHLERSLVTAPDESLQRRSDAMLLHPLL